MVDANETGSCSTDAYSEWYHSELNDTESLPLTLHHIRTDLLQVQRGSRIWKVMNWTSDDHETFRSLYGGRRPKRLNISKGHAMDVATEWCKERVGSLEEARAGGHGPPSDYLSDDYHGDFLLSVHDAMCDDYCIASDSLRSEAIAMSKCDCLQLSTKEDDISYTKEGDFCLKNSGYILCDKIDLNVCNECGYQMNDDFACARRNYDAIEVPLRGFGYECNGGGRRLVSTVIGVVGYLVMAFSLLR